MHLYWCTYMNVLGDGAPRRVIILFSGHSRFSPANATRRDIPYPLSTATLLLVTTGSPSSKEGHRTVSKKLLLSRLCISDATLARQVDGAIHSITTLHIHCGGLLRPPVLYRLARRRKSLVALYTCLAFYAVHLEVASDLSDEQFLLTLQRFSTCRRTAKHILSDNAPQF